MFYRCVLFLLLVSTGVLGWLAPGPSPTASDDRPDFGDPLPGLSAADRALFEAGKEDFEEVEEIDEGLGPAFNARGCGECHTFPAVGGGSAVSEVRFGRQTGNHFDELLTRGGSLLQLFAIRQECQELLPPQANRVGARQTTPLFGSGLLEAVADEQVIAYAARQARQYPGQAGQIHYVRSVSEGRLRVGRFGWRSQHALLLDFSGDAYVGEMGITNDLFPDENAPNGDQARLRRCDAVADPEDERDPDTGRRGIDNFTNFMRFLAPPPRLPYTAEVRRGKALFEQVGCGVCHFDGYTIDGRIGSARVDNQIYAFSDFLLHDVGTGDGVGLGVAGPQVFRTPPLWGLRASAPYLHNGSAATIERAIERHGGQATTARAAFRGLSTADRAALLAFLNSL